MSNFIYHFDLHQTDGNADMQDLLGGKGAGLAEMSNLGLPIPPGFTISTDLCKKYYTRHEKLSKDFLESLQVAIKLLESKTGKTFGGGEKPLLLSVRSGAKISMPGMMDTILNLGMNDEVAAQLAKETKNPRFAYDSYRRFLEMYGSVVLEIPSYIFEETYEQHKNKHNITQDKDLSAEILLEIIEAFKAIFLKYSKTHFETDPQKQLLSAIKAVLKSWMSPRAIVYRKIHNLPDADGTAVNIQSMVFGNRGDLSATGVVFTRCPSVGENKIFGEFLINAQGEDVVSGVRTPHPILAKENPDGLSMQEQMPKVYKELKEFCHKLEKHYGDMQDIEFTAEEGRLYILQTRSGKRSAAAAVKIAVDMTNEGIIDQKQALLRIDPESLNQLLHSAVDYAKPMNQIASGLPASPGAATGMVVFSPYDAEELSHHHKIILVRNDTSPEDIKGMHVSAGILTARGGMTSHAAVVARGMGKPCVCGVNGMVVNEREKFMTTASGHVVKHGDIITIDGGTGKIMLGTVDLIQPNFSEEFQTILTWSDLHRDMGIRTNAETVLDATVGMNFGAEGIGLCRTEHMFFDKEKIPLVREMIIAHDAEHRKSAIDKLHKLQIDDFKSLFEVMHGRSINIRLLDPPLHEFLPTEEKDKEDLAKRLGVDKSVIDHRLHVLHELNPMLGHRGCRLGISYPEIYIMQVEAILEAMFTLYHETHIKSSLELMIPLISDATELEHIKNYVLETIKAMENKFNVSSFEIKLGTMIELPRAALLANKIAPMVEYFSFGTNDLTQTTYGISRDDIGSFLPKYLEQKIFPNDPFVKIDEAGVGELMEIAIKRGLKANNNLYFGVCGEHAGHPESIDFFQRIGADYISCSPYRVPIARVAAARSKILQDVTQKA